MVQQEHQAGLPPVDRLGDAAAGGDALPIQTENALRVAWGGGCKSPPHPAGYLTKPDPFCLVLVPEEWSVQSNLSKSDFRNGHILQRGVTDLSLYE